MKTSPIKEVNTIDSCLNEIEKIKALGEIIYIEFKKEFIGPTRLDVRDGYDEINIKIKYRG